VRSDIKPGKLRLGDQLPETYLANRCAVDRMTVRKAIADLDQHSEVVVIDSQGRLTQSAGARRYSTNGPQASYPRLPGFEGIFMRACFAAACAAALALLAVGCGSAPGPSQPASPTSTATPTPSASPTPRPTPSKSPVKHTTAPAPTHSAAPTAQPAPAPAASCYPLTNGGNCYEPGEFCRNSDHGVTGLAGDGEKIKCEDNNGWRWEPI